MKKVFSLALCAALILSLAACGSSSESSSMVESEILSEDTPLASSPSNFKIGIGVVSTTSESHPASSDEYGNASFNATVCGLCVDDSGNILGVRFDTLEAGLGFDAAGAFTDDIGADILTKRELGDDYGIGAVSSIGKEWYEQMDALESWMIGKSINEVMSMKVYERDATHRHVPDEEDLKTSVTISVTDQLRALEKAYADATDNLQNFSSSYFDEEAQSSSDTAGENGDSSSDMTDSGSSDATGSDSTSAAESGLMEEQYSDDEAMR